MVSLNNHGSFRRGGCTLSSIITALSIILFLNGVDQILAGIIHHEPGDLQTSYGLFNLLDNEVNPSVPRSSENPLPTIVTECPPNVMFVIDGSGSISYNGFETAKNAVVREIQTLIASFSQVDIGVVVFSEDNYLIDLKSRTEAEYQQLMQEILNLQHPRLGTDLDEAIRLARLELAAYSVNANRAFDGDKSGNVMVLFTDGQVTPAVEARSAQEVRQAQEAGILVLIDTVEEPSLTVQNIAPTVLESRTPIDWLDFVACPPTTIPPPTGSACRDFYMVVDGSDAVLTFEGTIRQYLAYTALRYQGVDNAIGVNIYGTDTNVQARNTMIRMTTNKYGLADDVRQELVFPRSRGAGTDKAVIQSIGLLNDDIRPNPAGLVLIMFATPLNLAATADAIRQSRNQGYPVAIIRVGQVSQNELLQLSGGDMNGVYQVDYVTDLFGVNFDQFLCGQTGSCNLNSQSCVNPYVFQQSSCSCVCPNQCSVGYTHNANCQCVCENQCPPGQTQDSACLCRCSTVCPQGTRQNSDCTCSPCPNRCANNQYQDSTCACQCNNACPVFQRPDANCNCVCEVDGRPPDFQGLCDGQRQQCSLSQASCGSLVFDPNTCSCVGCPAGSIPLGINSCQCADPNQRYDSFTNRCVGNCPSDARVSGSSCQCIDVQKVYDSIRNQCVCPFQCTAPFSVQDPNNCQCTCTNACPADQFNDAETQCECLCRNTFNVPVEGICRSCPPDAQQQGTTCVCFDSNETYNSITNTCDSRINCPPDAFLSGSACQCTDSNKRYDAFSNTCVCQTACTVPNSIQDPNTCQCSCSNVCPTGQFNNFETNCDCWCLSTFQPAVNGLCITCPPNSQPLSVGTCVCNDPNQTYNPTTNTCDQRCPTDAVFVGNTCQCTSSSKRYDPFTNQCVCQTSCNADFIQDLNTCACSCRNSCPAGQYNNVDTDCICLCQTTNTQPVNGLCLNCPPNSVLTGATCTCTDPSQTYNPVTNICEQNCPPGSFPVGTSCQCTDSNKRYDPFSNTCVCQTSCNSDYIQDLNTCACTCRLSCPSGQYNNENTDCICLCQATNVPPVGGICLNCPVNAVPAGTTCTCLDPSQTYNPVTNLCEQNCPPGSFSVGTTCQCTDGNKRYDSFSNTCVCQTPCGSDFNQDPNTCACTCRNTCPFGQYNNEDTDCICLCQSTNVQPVGGICLNCPPNSNFVGGTCVCTLQGYTYNTITNTCDLNCPSDAFFTGTTCQCTSSSKRYNPVSNSCDCATGCSSNYVQDPITCACSCINTCPVGQYNNENTDCICLCQSTNAAPVNGICLTCPTNSIQSGNTCICNDPRQTYNSITNNCDLNCPSDAFFTGTTCQCTSSSKRYNPVTNSCDCATGCSSNYLQDPITCACSCINTCPVGQYNNENTDCICLCQSTNIAPINGICLTCPANSIQSGNTCICNDPRQTYNIITNNCDLNCPTDAINLGSSCQCTNGNKRYDPASNICVCQTSCASNYYQDANTCACSCRNTCPSGQYNSVDTDCICLCQSTNQPPVSGICLNCPSNSVQAGSTCICNDPRQTYNIVTNNCELNCPSDAYLLGSSCQCTSANKRYDPASNICVCNTGCASNYIQDLNTCACACRDTCPIGQYNNENTDCICLCQSTNVPPVAGVCITCPPNSVPLESGGCLCTNQNEFYNSVTNTCDRNCPSDAFSTGSSCQCTNNNKVYDAVRNQCVCQTQCTIPSSYQDQNTCACLCSSTCPADQFNSLETGCACWCRATNAPPTLGACNNCPADAIPLGSTSCQCTDGNKRYDAVSNTCVCQSSCPIANQIQDLNTCACSCPTFCPPGQFTNAETGCACWCLSTFAPAIGGVCITCPSDAQVVGTSCVCNDPTEVYNPATNICERNCPSDAYPSGSSCECNNINKIYNTFSNRCECRSPCTVPNTVQDPNTCACACLNTCPSDQYNSPTDCRCLCQLDNSEPLGGLCADRQQCNLNPNSCIAPLVPNLDPAVCQCVMPPDTGDCSPAEWQCENGALATRHCSGQCVCQCSAQFTGARCEIRVDASLCDECHYFQGIYKAGIPGYCDLFVNCQPVLSAGTDERGRPNAFTATVQSCGPGTYYVIRDDGYEGCNWLSEGQCTADLCNSLAPNSRYADPASCQRYFQCGNDQQLESEECCPAGQRFDANTQECITDPSCPDICTPCVTETGGGGVDMGCQYLPVNGNPNQYYSVTQPSLIQTCPSTLIFDIIACTCLGSQLTVYPIYTTTTPGICMPTYQNYFDGIPANAEDTVSRVTFQGAQAGQFTGMTDLVIKPFAESGFYTPYFRIDLKINFPQPLPSGGQRMAVITNADCDVIESVSITVDSNNFYFTVYQEGSTQPAEIVIPYYGLSDASGWYTISLVYSRESGTQFIASVGSSTVTYQGPVSLTEPIGSRRCALHLGYGFQYTGLVANVDEIVIWRCRP